MTIARLIGYWRENRPATDPSLTAELAAEYARVREQGRMWPDPAQFVDRRWNRAVGAGVADFLQKATLVNQYRGISPCRFCGCRNGSAELTDGAYCWPEGLAHYVNEHDIRLPQEFVSHALSNPARLSGLPQPSFDDLGSRDRSWPGPNFADRLWGRGTLTEPYIDTDPSWWLLQTGCDTENRP